MNLFLIITLSAIFAETSYLTLSSAKKCARRGNRHARRRVFVDTSSLMDGRILSVARAGFIGDELIIPRSVIRELQLLADGNDAEKRARARYGLDIANELKDLDGVELRILADSDDRRKVDERLLELATEYDGIILTNDFNLAKVASTENIEAININNLAQGLRSEYLPGDHLQVKIVSVGSNPHQGVAYLPDATMVVVDGAEKYAGKNQLVEIEFMRYLQTNAGKMMFAKIIEKPKTNNKKRQPIKNEKPKVNGRKSRQAKQKKQK